MPNFADGSAISRAQVLDDLEILRLQIQVKLNTDLKLRLVTPIARSGPEIRILGGRGRFGSGGGQSKTLDILALHRARGKSVGHVGQTGTERQVRFSVYSRRQIWVIAVRDGVLLILLKQPVAFLFGGGVEW